jgi:uncharacterized membrane protein
MAITYGTLIDEVQSRIVALLRADTTSVSIRSKAGETVVTTLADLKIVDGIPKEIQKGTAENYVIVHSGEVHERRLTITKRRVEIHSSVEIVSRREANIRQITDLVRKVIITNERTSNFVGAHLVWCRIETANLNFILDSNNVPIYTMDLDVVHEFTGGA